MQAVEGVDIAVRRNECAAIVGESGCGKGVSALVVMGLLNSPLAVVKANTITFDGSDLLNMQEKDLQNIRGKSISIIFQDALNALNSVAAVGRQIDEVYFRHVCTSKKEAKARSIEALRAVGLPSPKRRYYDYPHQLSGGMRQRVLIAMAFYCNPKLIIADEPTTALDVTIQAQLLDLLMSLQKAHGTSLILIAHDLSVVARTAETVYQIIKEPMRIKGGFTKGQTEKRAAELLEWVGLSSRDLNRYPSDFSGGQKQRIGIARAISMEPSLLICDEPVSALDVSVHAQIINLLMDLRERFNLTHIFISHNLATVRNVCNKTTVMYLGNVMEYGETAKVFKIPSLRTQRPSFRRFWTPTRTRETAGLSSKAIYRAQ
ncbi:MAG: ATP-binding cassette domain-containing protein [Clostridiales bacterium]|nr:ATP-binding cassette domain-containing protein [Clostridiales bacterium]